MDNDGVKITVSVEYAVQALLEIAAQDLSESIVLSSHEIASRQEIPQKFLESILRKLSQAGMLLSIRGPLGGYRLSRPSDQITIAEIIRVIEGPLAAVGDRAPEGTKYRRSAKHLTDVWIATRVALRDVLENITIADVLSGDFESEIKQSLRRKDAWSRREI